MQAQQRLQNAQNRKQSETGGLAFILNVKLGARVMLTVNIDLQDRLINGQIGTILQVSYNGNKVNKIYVKFDDPKAGLKASQADGYVPIERCETFIKVRCTRASSSGPAIQRIQFPLMLSWACSVHKTQGLTLPKGVVLL